MSTLLSVRNLTTTFTTERGIARAVDGVSFDLAAGETLGIVGESGSGKTVMALSILRLVPEPPGKVDPEASIEYQGRDISKLSNRELRPIRGGEIAMVFQDPASSMNPVLTVGSQIDETVRAHLPADRRTARERSIELLGLVGLPDPHLRVHDYPHEMSGGMLQRAMIAMALAGEPEILIADEPTTALDVTIQAQILELLSDLKSRLGMALLLITHDLGVVAGVADRVLVIYGGRVIEEAPAEALFDKPRHPYTRGLLKAIPRMDRPTRRLDVIPGAVPAATAWPSGCRFHPRCSFAWDRCHDQEPPLLEADGGWPCRCWLVEEPERDVR